MLGQQTAPSPLRANADACMAYLSEKFPGVKQQ